MRCADGLNEAKKCFDVVVVCETMDTKPDNTGMRTVATATLTLEPQVAAHADAMFAVLSDPAIYEFENAPPASAEWLRTRFTKLETRQSADGQEQWLNWVIRLPSHELIGYVQATVRTDASALIAYELGSAFWGKGLAHQAVSSMISELVSQYDTRELWAVLKRANHRSTRLLTRLAFTLATDAQHVELDAEPDESVMHRLITASSAPARRD